MAFAWLRQGTYLQRANKLPEGRLFLPYRCCSAAFVPVNYSVGLNKGSDRHANARVRAVVTVGIPVVVDIARVRGVVTRW